MGTLTLIYVYHSITFSIYLHAFQAEINYYYYYYYLWISATWQPHVPKLLYLREINGQVLRSDIRSTIFMFLKYFFKKIKIFFISNYYYYYFDYFNTLILKIKKYYFNIFSSKFFYIFK